MVRSPSILTTPGTLDTFAVRGLATRRATEATDCGFPNSPRTTKYPSTVGDWISGRSSRGCQRPKPVHSPTPLTRRILWDGGQLWNVTAQFDYLPAEIDPKDAFQLFSHELRLEILSCDSERIPPFPRRTSRNFQGVYTGRQND
jgi:hypothetical protein